jgi:hypothetical protein
LSAICWQEITWAHLNALVPDAKAGMCLTTAQLSRSCASQIPLTLTSPPTHTTQQHTPVTEDGRLHQC